MILESGMSIDFYRLRARGFVAIFGRAACLVVVAMLLAFPANNIHRFENHFRLPRVRRSIEKNTPFAQPELTGAEQIANADVAPTVLIAIATAVFSDPPARFQIVSEIPITRFLLRPKLGPSRSGESDPLS
jgi:hypothetical protein